MKVQVLSYTLLKDLDSNKRVKKILSIVKDGDVAMIEGKLSSEEQMSLTTEALKSISGKFSGIEVAYLSSTTSKGFFEKVREGVVNALSGGRVGITVVGPSKVIKEIKMDPNNLEILFK